MDSSLQHPNSTIQSSTTTTSTLSTSIPTSLNIIESSPAAEAASSQNGIIINDSNKNTLSYAEVSAMSTNLNPISAVSSKFTNPHSQSQNSTKSFKKPDYTDDTLKTPKKDQGLIIESIEGLKIKQYLEAIGNIIGVENIIYASRLSRDRICIYLNSRDLINEITENFDHISIDEYNLNIRPLMLRAKKYYLNRVCPSIPSSYLHDTISALGIR